MTTLRTSLLVGRSWAQTALRRPGTDAAECARLVVASGAPAGVWWKHPYMVTRDYVGEWTKAPVRSIGDTSAVVVAPGVMNRLFKSIAEQMECDAEPARAAQLAAAERLQIRMWARYPPP